MKRMEIQRRDDLTGEPYELKIIHANGDSAAVLIDPCPELKAIEKLWRQGAKPRWIKRLDTELQ